MINIAICDDESEELERVHDFLTRYIKEHKEYEIRIVTFSAPLELISYVVAHGGFDVFLLDIYMDGMLGTDIARQLRQRGEKGEIIFLTTSKDHAIDAFEVDAAQYLIKPYTENAFFLVLDKVLYRIKNERRHMITLKVSGGFIRLFTRDMVFSETGRNNYQIIHTSNGEKVEVRMTSSGLFKMISQTKLFVRCGVSIIVNLKFIRQIKKGTIILDSGEELYYPYRAYKKLKEEFLSFQMSREGEE